MNGTYIHKKTGNRYYVMMECLNCTNAQDGQEMVVYVKDGQAFVREKKEFFEKFEQEEEEPMAPEPFMFGDDEEEEE